MAKKSSSAQSKYTQPELRESIKQKLKEGDKGGQPGQWSARKSQMLAAEYKKQGGGYAEKKSDTQKNLDKWGDEAWQTADNTKAVQGNKTSRYLPKKAWDTMSDIEKKKTEAAKEKGSEAGEQYVANTPAAKKARKKVAKKAVGRPKKKAVGRPKKATAKKTATKKVAKKAVGRPKKKAVGRPKKATAKKKVGRPRKTTTAASTGAGKKVAKRPVGRPRKNAPK